VASAYDKWGADLVVAEKNFGGDMVESTIRNGHPHLNVKLIWSARGKIVRAEPISALYEQGKVFHREPFFYSRTNIALTRRTVIIHLTAWTRLCLR
jgi:phage terminase large subunit-like protein